MECVHSWVLSFNENIREFSVMRENLPAGGDFGVAYILNVRS